jgi:hypothetical protein
MKGRDLLILGAVLLVAGFAVADALRSEGSSLPTPQTQAERTTTRSVITEPEQPADLGRASFPEVLGAGGSVVFTQTGSCAVREVDLPTGLELPNTIDRSSCELWAPPVTYRVAVGLGEAREDDTVPFRLADLQRGNRNLGSYQALFGFIIFSDDGQRVAWCGRSRVGFDLELGENRARRLPACPVAYTSEEEIAFAEADRLVVDGRTVLRTSGSITFVHYGQDGSIGLVVDGTRIERWREGRRRQSFELPERFRGRTPVLSPDNCALMVRAGENMRILDVGCSGLGSGTTLPGTSGSWSPDGQWVALAGPQEIVFVPVKGEGDTVRWPVGAVDIVWRRS